jgi:hypothetical protein
MIIETGNIKIKKNLKKGEFMVNSRRFRDAVTTIFLVLVLCGELFAGSSPRRTSDRLLRIVPAKSLFCVRINNFEKTTEAINEFLKEVAPPSFDAGTKTLSKLGNLLGNEDLRGVNTKRNFAIFGIEVPDEIEARHPMANIFMGALIPVRNYDKFISDNPNIS